MMILVKRHNRNKHKKKFYSNKIDAYGCLINHLCLIIVDSRQVLNKAKDNTHGGKQKKIHMRTFLEIELMKANCLIY